MKHVGVEYETEFKVGNYLDPFVVTAECTPSEEENIYDIRIVVKSKKRNRRRIHTGQIELLNPSSALDDVKAYMECGNIVESMLEQLSLTILLDYPKFYPAIS